MSFLADEVGVRENIAIEVSCKKILDFPGDLHLFGSDDRKLIPVCGEFIGNPEESFVDSGAFGLDVRRQFALLFCGIGDPFGNVVILFPAEYFPPKPDLLSVLFLCKFLS